MKTKEEIYSEIEKYIEGSKHNRPCTLSTIKKGLRTKEIVDLVFSHPRIFDLTVEIKHVPEEFLTDELLVRYILYNPKNIYQLEDKYQTQPVLLAFEYVKRKYERLSAMVWGRDREVISYTDKAKQYKDSISNMCDEVSLVIDDKNIPDGYFVNVDSATGMIINYCKTKSIKLEEKEKYNRKYNYVDFNLDKRLYLLVSGVSDSGKTYFSQLLHNTIRNCYFLDSDEMYHERLITASIEDLVPQKYNVVIFCDVDAHRFFGPDELKDSDQINIVVYPSTIEKMQRFSKGRQGANFLDYQEYVTRRLRNYDSIESPIKVVNTFNDDINIEIDRTIEEISKRLGYELIEKDSTISSSSSCDWQFTKKK